jgi:hypothetical protein
LAFLVGNLAEVLSEGRFEAAPELFFVAIRKVGDTEEIVRCVVGIGKLVAGFACLPPDETHIVVAYHK